MELKIYNQSGELKLTASTSSSSTWNRELMAEDTLSVSFTHTSYVPLEVNDYAVLEGVRFSVKKEYKPKQKNRQTYSYSVKLYAPIHDAEQVKYLYLTDGEYNPQFSLDGTPREHLQKWVDNMNRISGGPKWSVGDVIVTSRKTIDYNNTFCWEALGKMADAFDTEWWADGFIINLSRCEHGQRISLGYLKGLTSLTQVENSDSVKFFTRLIPIGSTRNIDRSRYGFSRLQLPGREKYIDRNTQYGLYEHVEEAAFADIYPHYTGTVTEVRSAERKDNNGKPFTIYYFKDAGLAFDPNAYELPGLKKRVSFQSGDLNGHGSDDDGTYYFEANYDSAAKEWEIITLFPDETRQLPGGNLIPRIGDKYIPWNIRMPEAYESSAEQDYLAAVNDYLEKYSRDVSKYGGDTDYVYMQENSVPMAIGQNVRLLSDEYFHATGGYYDTRMTKVVCKLDNLNMAAIECSNSVGKGWRRQVDSGLSELKYVLERQQENGLADILKSWDRREATDYRLMTALRIIREIERKALSKEKSDRTDHSLEIGGDLTVDGLLKALGGISVGGKGSITSDGIATLQILKALVMAEVKALSVSGAASVGSLDSEGNISTGTDVWAKGTVHSLNSVVQALSRTHDLTVEQTADVMHQIIHEYISSNKFVSGFLGEGFKVWKDDAGLWHGELDMLTVRKVFTVFELMVQKVVHQGGMAVRSAAGGKITKVTDGGSYWRCEHDSTDDFVANDQVLCQVFTGTKMKRYWRLVTSAGAGYFNLSKTDCEAGSVTPEVGDDVAVLGNRTNAARQSAQIDCAVGADAPYRDDYAGINSYSLSGKLVTRTGNLTGITDDDFGPLSGSGLYGRNVYLKGIFRLLSGKTVEDYATRLMEDAKSHADARIRETETRFEVREGQISSKVAEVNRKAAEVDTNAFNTDKSAKAAKASETNAGASAATVAAKLISVSEKESSINQTESRINTKVSEVNTKASQAAASASNAAGSAGAAASALQAVTTKQSEINQTAKGIELKASRVEEAAGRAEKAEASINLKADGIVIQASQKAAQAAAKRTEVWIDARGLDQSKYYPVTINLSVGIPMYTITVDRVLDVNRGKPSWSAHPGGFSTLCRWRTNASGWGTIGVQRTILDYTYAHCSVLPAGSIGQLTYGSLEYIYVRGGSMYHVMAEGATDTNISLHTSAYTWSSGQYSQKLDILTVVDAPVPDLSQRPTVDEIKSQFTIDTGGISMLGKKISLAGMVTFSSFDTSAQAVINGKATPAQVAAAKSAAISAAASDASNKANNALNGAKGYTDQLKTTIIDGDYIKTTLIRAGSITADKIMAGSITGDRIMAGSITADKLKAGSITADKINVSSVQSAVVTAEKIAALSITTGNLTVTTGAKIGGWAIEGNALKITQAAGAKILVEPSGTRFLRINDETAKLMSVRADGVTGIYIYTQDTAGKCLMTIAQTGGKAIESYGNCIFTARTGELIDFVGSTRIGGLSVKSVRTSSFYTCSNDDTWITCTNSSHINITLPASPTPGKVIYIKKDSGGGVGIRGNGKSIRCNQDYRTEIYIPGFNIARLVYDGAYWQAMCSWWTDS